MNNSQFSKQNNTLSVAVKERPAPEKLNSQSASQPQKTIHLKLPLGLIGIEEFTEFKLEFYRDNPVTLLQSAEIADLVFYLIDPFNVCSDYTVTIEPYDYEVLKTDTLENLLIFSILTLNQNIEEITCNLLGPLLINTDNAIGKQCINNGWKTRHYINSGTPLDS